MRSPRKLIDGYIKVVPGAERRTATQDVVLVDLCLHFLSTYLPGERVEAVPYLLQGYHSVFGRSPPVRQLTHLRELARGFSSPMTWAAALRNHAAATLHTAYDVKGSMPRAQAAAIPSVRAVLGDALDHESPYRDSDVEYAQPGQARVRTAAPGFLRFTIPDHKPPARPALTLPSREANPAVLVSWQNLESTAARVDAREARGDWPAWLSPLNLQRRLAGVRIKSIDPLFFSQNRLAISGMHHIVGMLSSGKSTFLQTLLFTLASPDFGKRALVLTQDTSSAADLVARLRLHGIAAGLISSVRNRPEHLASIHWSNSSADPVSALLATAHKTKMLGIACPLEGMQSLDEDDFRFTTAAPRLALRMEERPCLTLLQPPGSKENASGTAEEDWKPRTCPFIADCPTHAQQTTIADSQVLVMTVQAFLGMSPAAHVTGRRITFAEVFQHLVDVVFIDEVDSVQRIFDDVFCIQENLLSPSEATYSFATNRAVMNALQRRGGTQYSRPINAQWHSRLNHLQSSIALIYQLLLNHGATIEWLTKNQTFTAASLLCDLWRVKHPQPDAKNGLDDDFRFIVEATGTMSDELVKERDSGGAAYVGPSSTDSRLAPAMRALADAQREMLASGELGLEELETGVKGDNASPLKSLAAFDLTGATAPKHRVKRIGFSAQSTAIALALAALSNACLALFSWLVRNQGAVEEDFELTGIDVFRRLRRLNSMYGSLVPSNPSGAAYGLMFESDQSRGGGTLRLVHHVGVGRYLLTHLDRLLEAHGQAGPHVVMLSGTSWAGGGGDSDRPPGQGTASPKFDVQVPIAAILEQPRVELDALKRCVFELSPITDEALAVSGLPLEDRHANLQRIAEALCLPHASGSELEMQWLRNETSWGTELTHDRRRALVVCSNYEDARVFALAASQVCGPTTAVYLLVRDRDIEARSTAARRSGGPSATSLAMTPRLLPRSRIEEFGHAPAGSVLVAPIQPVSRGHNILNTSGRAAISSIYFVHRPHPRPDDLDAVVAEVNRFALNVVTGRTVLPDQHNDVVSRGRWLRFQGRRLVDEALASRVAYSAMSEDGQTRFAWDLITLLWQTVGRGIRSGVPVYVRFVDKRFSPEAFEGRLDDATTSCLRRCVTTLQSAVNAPVTADIASSLYGPFLQALECMFESIEASTKQSGVAHADA